MGFPDWSQTILTSHSLHLSIPINSHLQATQHPHSLSHRGMLTKAIPLRATRQRSRRLTCASEEFIETSGSTLFSLFYCKRLDVFCSCLLALPHSPSRHLLLSPRTSPNRGFLPRWDTWAVEINFPLLRIFTFEFIRSAGYRATGEVQTR